MAGEGIIIGVDEAGRGPVLGDMVIACTVLSREAISRLKQCGVRDSKLLDPPTREKLYNTILSSSILTVSTIVSPVEIDYMNLNKLATLRIIEILRGVSILLPHPERVERIVIDMVKGYANEIALALTRIYPRARVIVEEKADRNYIEASAASIIAKVLRDKGLYSAKELLGDFGSGYPTDPRTITWIKRVYSTGAPAPPIVRRSWKILKRISPDWYTEKTRGQRRDRRNRSLLDFI